MAAQNAVDAILKTIKSDISWNKCALKANKVTFSTKFGIPDLMERVSLYSETILTFKIQDGRPVVVFNTKFKNISSDFSWARWIII